MNVRDDVSPKHWKKWKCKGTKAMSWSICETWRAFSVVFSTETAYWGVIFYSDAPYLPTRIQYPPQVFKFHPVWQIYQVKNIYRVATTYYQRLKRQCSGSKAGLY